MPLLTRLAAAVREQVRWHRLLADCWRDLRRERALSTYSNDEIDVMPDADLPQREHR